MLTRMLIAVACFALPAAAEQRFDHKVRNDFFAGFAGDRNAMDRATKITEATLAANPDHAEALVWLGSATYFRAGEAFRGGDSQKGMELYGKGMAMMNKAVELAPDNIGVRIPRGAALLTATAFQRMDDRVRGEVKSAVADYQRAYDLQKGNLSKLGEHPLGQLLLGLGDGYWRLGDNESARIYFTQIEEMLPKTEYAKRAAAWRETGKLTTAQQQCYGCHVK